jgi:hypothetical protein
VDGSVFVYEFGGVNVEGFGLLDDGRLVFEEVGSGDAQCIGELSDGAPLRFHLVTLDSDPSRR